MELDKTKTMPKEAIMRGGQLRPPHHLGKEYLKDYNKGWRDSENPGKNSTFSEATGSKAYEDGYLDGSNREDQKWHLAWCQNHEDTDTGCGRA